MQSRGTLATASAFLQSPIHPCDQLSCSSTSATSSGSHSCKLFLRLFSTIPPLHAMTLLCSSSASSSASMICYADLLHAVLCLAGLLCFALKFGSHVALISALCCYSTLLNSSP